MKPLSDSARRARPLLGTFVDIAAAGASRRDIDAAIDAAFRAVAEAHRLMSFHEAGSDVGRLNRHASAHAVAVHPWTCRVLEAALELHHRSAGAFDIAVAPVMQALRLLPRAPDDLPSAPAAARGSDAIELLPENRVRFHHPGTRIDLGGIAKGFAVDRAVDVLRDHGMPRGLVNAGGDLAAFGAGADFVHIRDPRDPLRVVCGIEVKDEALASTGRGFDPVSGAQAGGPAIIDPRNGHPARAIAGATVRAPSCMVADALTKVVVVAGEAALALLDRYRASAMFVSAGGDIHLTSDWQQAVRLAA